MLDHDSTDISHFLAVIKVMLHCYPYPPLYKWFVVVMLIISNPEYTINEFLEFNISRADQIGYF